MGRKQADASSCSPRNDPPHERHRGIVSPLHYDAGKHRVVAPPLVSRSTASIYDATRYDTRGCALPPPPVAAPPPRQPPSYQPGAPPPQGPPPLPTSARIGNQENLLNHIGPGLDSSLGFARCSSGHQFVDDLQATNSFGLGDSSGLFPSRPIVLPDELRGALLLPSETSSESPAGTTESWALMRQLRSTGDSPARPGSTNGLGIKAQASRRPPVPAAGPAGDEQRGTTPSGTASGNCAAVVRCVTRDGALRDCVTRGSACTEWSLGDPDVNELLEQVTADASFGPSSCSRAGGGTASPRCGSRGEGNDSPNDLARRMLGTPGLGGAFPSNWLGLCEDNYFGLLALSSSGAGASGDNLGEKVGTDRCATRGSVCTEWSLGDPDVHELLEQAEEAGLLGMAAAAASSLPAIAIQGRASPQTAKPLSETSQSANSAATSSRFRHWPIAAAP